MHDYDNACYTSTDPSASAPPVTLASMQDVIRKLRAIRDADGLASVRAMKRPIALYGAGVTRLQIGMIAMGLDRPIDCYPSGRLRPGEVAFVETAATDEEVALLPSFATPPVLSPLSFSRQWRGTWAPRYQTRRRGRLGILHKHRLRVRRPEPAWPWPLPIAVC